MSGIKCSNKRKLIPSQIGIENYFTPSKKKCSLAATVNKRENKKTPNVFELALSNQISKCDHGARPASVEGDRNSPQVGELGSSEANTEIISEVVGVDIPQAKKCSGLNCPFQQKYQKMKASYMKAMEFNLKLQEEVSKLKQKIVNETESDNFEAQCEALLV